MGSPTDLRERLQRTLGSLYTVERELGGGGMSRVFLADDARLGRRVVVKVLHPDLAAGVSAARFEREIRLAARLQHPHIVPLLAAGDVDGLPYFTMPYVEGESLRQRLAREGALPVLDTMRLMGELADALGYAHGHAVVHRDLKPENVLLSGGHAVIADFGVAKALTAATHGEVDREARAAGTGPTTTALGLAVGTPAYMAPEQALGDPETDHRADLYALGLVAYELLAGAHPFAGRAPLQLVTAHLTESPAPLTGCRPDVPSALAELIHRCLAKSPADRPRSADEIRDAVAAVRTRSETTPVSRAALTPHAPDPVATRGAGARQRVLVVAGAGIVLAVAVGTAALLTARRSPTLDPSRVVVAVFDNQTGDPALDPLGRMAADWLTQGLVQTRLLDVVPSTSTLYAGAAARGGGPADARHAATTAEGLQALGEATGAGTVVAGTYYRQGDTLRFQAQVTDVDGGKLLRAIEPVSGPLDRPTEVVERLRQRVTAGLAALLDPKLGEMAWNTIEPPTYEAYREFMLGLQQFYRLEFPEAIAHLTRAAALDSSSTRSTHDLALFWIASAYTNQGRFADADSIERVLSARQEHLTPLNRHGLDFLRAKLRGDHAGYLDAVRRMHELTPGSDQSEWLHGIGAIRERRPGEALAAFAGIDERGPMGAWPTYWLALTDIHHALGDHRRELTTARRGHAQSPSLTTLRCEARALAAMGRIDDLDERLDESLTLPRHPLLETPGDVMESAALELRAHGHAAAARATTSRTIAWYRGRAADERETERARHGLGRALYLAGRWGEAQAVFERLNDERPDDPSYMGHLGLLAARRGDATGAEKLASRLAALTRPYLHGEHTFWRARIAAVLGQRERAVSLFGEAYQQGYPFDADFHVIVDVEPLRGYGPFEELVRPRG